MSLSTKQTYLNFPPPLLEIKNLVTNSLIQIGFYTIQLEILIQAVLQSAVQTFGKPQKANIGVKMVQIIMMETAWPIHGALRDGENL